MAGIDEVSARSVLADMQARLARDPAAALGVTSTATPEELRTAFLQLTKKFHPVRFGRMANDIQKLSNEVFLALRAAHDAIAKTLRRQSGPMPTARSSSASGPAPSLPVPPVPVASGSGVRPPQSGPRTTRPAPNEPAGQSPPAIPVTPSSAKAGARGTGPANVPRVAAPAPAAARPGSGPTSSPRDEAAVLDLLSRQQWDQARSALHQLQAREPSSKRIRALMCYARGREAQLAGQVDDARVELQDALDLDPELQLAKTALTELFTRRK